MHFGGIDRIPAYLDHVFGPADKLDRARRSAPGEIAGSHPSIDRPGGVGGGLIAVIAVQHAWALDQKLTDLTDVHGLVMVVNDARLVPGHR